MHSVDVSTSLWEAWGWTFCMLAFYIVVNCASAGPAVRRLFLASAGSVVAVLSVIALHQQLTGSPLTYGVLAVHGHTLWRYGRWEIHATLVNSVVFAGFLLSWAGSFWPFAAGRSRWNGFFFLLLSLGILVSRSWTACICLMVGTAFYHTLLYGSVAKRAFLIKIFFAGGLACVLMASWKLLQQAEGQYYVASMRLVYWHAAIRMFLTHPLTGIGLGGYATAFPYFKRAAGENTLFAHGLFWQILAETGLIGIVACGSALMEFSVYVRDSLEKNAWSSEESEPL